MVGSVFGHCAQEAPLRSKDVRSNCYVYLVVKAFACIGRVIAPVLHQVRGKNPEPHWLKELWNQQCRDYDIACADSPVGIAEQNGSRLRELLRYLHRPFLTFGGEGSDVA